MERSDCGYDFDEQEYLKDYQRFLEEIRKVVVGLTTVYSVTMIKAILTMWVCEGSVSDRLKTQYSNNVLLLDALLTILSSFNRGISANKVNVKAKQELIGTGRDIVQQFLAFPVGNSYEQDSYTIRFLMSFLWVLQQDQQSLMGYITLLISMLQNAGSMYG